MDAVVAAHFGGKGLAPHTHKKWGVNKEMEGWMVRGHLAPSSSDGDDDEDESSDERFVVPEAVVPFNSGTMHKGCPCRLHAHPTKEKDCPVLKRPLRF